MENQNIGVLIFAYCVLSLCCFAHWYKKNGLESVYRFALVIFLPVFGYLLLFVIWLWGKHAKNTGSNMPFLLEKTNKVLRPIEKQSIDLNAIINIVPMEEALLINSNNIKRKMVLDILRDDINKYPHLLKIAMVNEDAETSHYATTAIMETKRKMILKLQEMEEIGEFKGLAVESLTSYADTLKKILGSSLLNEENEKTARTMYKRVLEQMIVINPQEKTFLIERINCDIDTGDYSSALDYCQKLMTVHNQSEESFLMYLKIYYLRRNKKAFYETLSALEKSSVIISEPVANIIKYWTM